MPHNGRRHKRIVAPEEWLAAKEAHCEFCRYWALASTVTNVGQCRKYAPSIGGPGTGQQPVVGPVTGSTFWCAEFLPDRPFKEPGGSVLASSRLLGQPST